MVQIYLIMLITIFHIIFFNTFQYFINISYIQTKVQFKKPNIHKL